MERVVSTLNLPMELSDGEEPSFEITKFADPTEEGDDEDDEEYDEEEEDEVENDRDEQQDDDKVSDKEEEEDAEVDGEEFADEYEDDDGNGNEYQVEYRKNGGAGNRSDDGLVSTEDEEEYTDLEEDDILNEAVGMDIDEVDQEKIDELLNFDPKTANVAPQQEVAPHVLPHDQSTVNNPDPEQVIDASKLEEEDAALMEGAGYVVDRSLNKKKTN